MTVKHLRYRYSVRRRSNARNALGERLTVYNHQFFVAGEAPRQGSTTVNSDGTALRSDTTLRFQARYTPGILPGDQMVQSGAGTVYYVRQAIDIDGLKKFLQIVVSLTPAEST